MDRDSLVDRGFDRPAALARVGYPPCKLRQLGIPDHRFSSGTEIQHGAHERLRAELKARAAAELPLVLDLAQAALDRARATRPEALELDALSDDELLALVNQLIAEDTF